MILELGSSPKVMHTIRATTIWNGKIIAERTGSAMWEVLFYFWSQNDSQCFESTSFLSNIPEYSPKEEYNASIIRNQCTL